jgi:hypothetical protein
MASRTMRASPTTTNQQLSLAQGFSLSRFRNQSTYR